MFQNQIALIKRSGTKALFLKEDFVVLPPQE
jgi:hypothetical protein